MKAKADMLEGLMVEEKWKKNVIEGDEWRKGCLKKREELAGSPLKAQRSRVPELRNKWKPILWLKMR